MMPLTIMSMMISIMFMFMNHPLSMGLMLIIQTMLIALISGTMMNTFWFSYILLITMLSGALVLFIYMASVASNEKFNMSITMMMLTSMTMITALVSFFLVDQLSTNKMWSTSKKATLENEQILSLIKMFNIHNMSLTILMISYLFFTMIAISYIVNTYEGPLRTKN
uniref:NADH-ubiquinone oxidoreductase chain 6 n=1 Tax=Tapeinus singularis TaxID=1524541 RepID=A0A343W8T6_9HEMI|nr:NADH dehydrogenase subunit 6 [Tapeinus singularis]AVZ00776.1 NADH dehydrogenase subunit 6 [Tapeinus singularis]